jgi:hypothetical protein
MTKDGRTATAIVAAHPMGRELWVLVDGGRWASQVHSSDEKADADAAERYTRGIASGWLDSPGMTTARARRSGLNARSSWPGAEGRLEFCLRAGEQHEPNASTSGAFVAATWRAATLDEFRPAAAVGGSCGVCRERIVVRWYAITQCLFDGALGDRVGAGKVGDCACALQNAIVMCWIIRPSRQSRVEQLDGGVRHSQRMILGSQCAPSAGSSIRRSRSLQGSFGRTSQTTCLVGVRCATRSKRLTLLRGDAHAMVSDLRRCAATERVWMAQPTARATCHRRGDQRGGGHGDRVANPFPSGRRSVLRRSIGVTDFALTRGAIDPSLADTSSNTRARLRDAVRVRVPSTSAISTRAGTSLLANSSPPLLLQMISASSAASAPIGTICCTCARRRTRLVGQDMDGRCSRPAVTRWGWRRSARCPDRTCAGGSRTASSRPETARGEQRGTGSRRSAAFSASCRWRSRRRTKRAASSVDRSVSGSVPIPSSDREQRSRAASSTTE